MAENIGRYNIILEFLTQTNSENVKKEAGGLEKVFGRAKAAFAGIFAAQAIKSATTAIFDITKKYESYAKILEVALGSTRESEQALKLIQDTAKSTVFSVDELTASYIKFANRGIKLTKDEIIALGDLAASQGKSFDQLTEAVLDAQSGANERLRELGIVASKNGDEVSFTFRGVTKTVKATADEIKNAIIELGKLDGVAGSNAEQMGTLSGMVSNLGDNFESLIKNVGERLSPVFSGALSIIGKVVEKFNDFISIPVEEKLIAEQRQLNLLVTQITDANIKQEERNVLLAKLQQEYPNFLQNLDAEKVKNEELTKRLSQANEQYVLRIALAQLQAREDKAAEKFAAAANRLSAKNIKNQEILLDLNNKYNLGIDFGNKSLKERQELVLEGLNKVEKEGRSVGADRARVAGIDILKNTEQDFEDTKAFLEKVKDDTNALRIELNNILGIGDLTGAIVEEEEKAIDKLNGGTVKPSKPTAQKEKTRLEQLKEDYETILADIEKLVSLGKTAEARGNKIIGDYLLKQIENAEIELKKILEPQEGVGNIPLLPVRIAPFAFGFESNTSGKKEAVDEVSGGVKKVFEEGIKKGIQQANKEKYDKLLGDNIFGLDDEQLKVFEENIKTAFDLYKSALTELIQYEIDVNQQRIELQETRVEKARELAEKGKIEQLRIEEDRLAELQAKQREYANSQKTIANLQITASSGVAVANAIEGITAAFKTGGPAGIALGIAQGLALTAQIAALITSVKSQFSSLQFKDGIERLNGPGTRRSDSIPVWLSRDERVVDAATNEKMGFNFPNKMLPKAVALYKQFPNLARQLSNGGGSTVDNSKRVEAKLDQTLNVLESMAFNVNMDADGLAATLVKKKGNITYRKSLI